MARTAKKSTSRTKKTAAARSSRASTSKRAADNKPATTVKVSTLRTTVENIRSFLLSASLVYLLLTAAVIGFVASIDTRYTLAVQTRDFFANQEEVVLGPASEVLATFPLKYPLIAILLLSALGSILLATKLRSRYEATVAAKISGFRWIYLGIIVGLTMEFIALLVGITDLATQKLILGSIIAASLFGWLAERENVASANPKWLAYIGALFACAIAWLPIIGSLIGTSVYGMERFSWYVYAAAAVVFVGYLGIALNQYRQIRDRTADYVAVEANYWRFDFLTKLALTLVIIIGLYKI